MSLMSLSAIEGRGVAKEGVFPLAAKGSFLVGASGSVVNFEGDAIVNAANTMCLGGAGVDGAIAHAGGDDLADAREALPVGEDGYTRCPTGEARITIGGELKSKYCIHAVGPMFGRSAPFDEDDKLLHSAYTSALQCAREKDLHHIGFALLSAGIFKGGRSLLEVLQIGVKAVSESAYPELIVYLVGFTDNEISTLMDACTVVFGAEVTEEVTEEVTDTK